MVSPTHFEDLSNELLLDIFDYLDGYHMLEAFSNLNNRFQHLINSSYFLLKLNISFMSQTSFNKRSSNIIRPYINQIISLQLSKPFFMKNFFTSFPIDTSFNRLESLVLNDFNVNDNLSILISLRQLPRLFSLNIFGWNCRESCIIFQSICRLPVLKYATLSFLKWDSIHSFPPATNNDQRSMTLEYLASNISHDLASIYSVLSYTPQLRHLSVERIPDDRYIPIEQSILPCNLTSISIRYWLLPFNAFASFIAIVGFKLELLRVSTFHRTTLLDAYQWQQLILHRMPHLRTFLFYYHGPLMEDIDGSNQCRALLDQFSSRFWIERRWFFTHRHCNCYSSYGPPYLSFYSTQIRWLEFCETDDYLNNNICSYQDPIFNLSIGPRMAIQNRNVVADFPFQFPRVTELRLTDNDTININSFIDNLSHIIILTNITYLNISINNQWLNCFIKLLNHMPNVQKLVLDLQSSSETEVWSNQLTDTVDLECNNNVKNVQIIDIFSFVTVQLINKLFPRMECLQIVNVITGNDIIVEPLKTMIDNEKLLDNYDIEYRHFKLCLSW
ncbi:unnamed protein product [Adineta steineri]|uniref:F-box domain-containing protein n=1 Tax=Adineta steineri TaxID=433720 RepID=A0A814E537_9BILA|nr:unnamed protein product [Adineta steineri]CAF1256505.1 unnamed protein product [Adineta steineri]